MDSIEQQAREENEADNNIRAGIRVYLEHEWDRQEVLDKIEEMYDEEADKISGASPAATEGRRKKPGR